MNAQNAVPKVVKCTRCRHVTNEKKVGDSCERIIETTNGRLRCNGTYHLTVGQKFRDKNGYSKTLKRNMTNNGLDPTNLEESIKAYKKLRKERRKVTRLKRAKKRSESKALRASKPAKNKSNGKSVAKDGAGKA